MNAIVQTKRVLPEERAKIWNQVTKKTVAIGMIADESIYSITSKITTTNEDSCLSWFSGFRTRIHASSV